MNCIPGILTIHRATSPDVLAAVRDHCERHHYLHRWPDPRSLPMAYALAVNGDLQTPALDLWGLMVFKKPQHHRQRGLFGYPGLPTAWQVLDLARVWIHPALQQPGWCVFSQFVGLCIRHCQADWLIHHPPRFPELPYHIELVISYCELAHHDGTAYRASGFVTAGLTSDGTKEIYCRKLKAPRKRWSPEREVQWPLLAGMPLRGLTR